MAEAVIDPAVSSTATEAPAEPKSFAEAQKSWTSEQRTEWQISGKEPEATPTAAVKPVSEKPAPVKAEAAPEAGSGEEDQEPEYYGTPDQIAKQRHAYAKKSQKIAELKAENRLLREQRTEKPAVAVAAPPSVEPKPVTGEPELPNIADYEDPKKYHEDMKKYHRDVRAFDRAQAERGQQEVQRVSQWQRELAGSKESHPDYEAVAFRADVPVSLPAIGVLIGLSGGTEVMYALGQNPQLAQDLAEATHIPGNFNTYAELAAAAESDPRLARQLAGAEAIVRHEAKRILASVKAGAKREDPDPKPITVSRAAPPAEKVTSVSSTTKDPYVIAEENYKRTGDKKFMEQMLDIEDDRARARLRK
jgi:hypothetical protein